MLTRDSHAWWLVMAGSIATAVASRLDLLDALIPENYHKQAHAVIELVAMVTGIFAGVARMSPLPISDQGRASAIQKNVESAETAGIAAAVASKAAETAAKASTVAVEASKVASVESAKAADPVDE